MPDTLDIPVPAGEGDVVMPSVVDDSVHVAGLTGLSSEVAACSGRRLARADQLAADADRMWSIAMTSPTVMAAMGFRVAQQSAGWPADKGTGTGGE